MRRQSNELPNDHLASAFALGQPTTSTSTPLTVLPNHHRNMPGRTDLKATHSSPRKSLYEGSTQYKHWRFSPKSLAAQRAAQNQEAVAKIRDAFELDAVSPLLICAFTRQSLMEYCQPGSSSSIEFLSADEERILVKLYVSKVGQLCAHFRFPEEVEASSVSYLKRFYIRNTVMDYHPKNVMCVPSPRQVWHH